MVKQNDNGDDFTIEINLRGGGERLDQIHQALILGIEAVGTHREQSGDKDHQDAVWILSTILKQCMLDKSQLNIGLGFHAYRDVKKAS